MRYSKKDRWTNNSYHIFLTNEFDFLSKIYKQFFFNVSEKPRKPFGSGASYAWTQCYLTITIYIILPVNQWLLDDGSNTSWSYSTATLTISDRCIAVCKWWFFVWFVGESPDFPLYPCGFWGFCYHGVITDLSFINDNSLIIKFSYSIPFLLENSYFIKIISSSKFKSTAGNILCI